MLKRNFLAVFVLAAFIIFSQGCYTMNQVGRSDSPIEIGSSKNGATGQHFTKSKKVGHFLWGLISPEDAGVEKLISDEVKAKKGSRAVNVKMKYQMTFIDGLLNAITGGIYSPFTLTVEGDVVKH